MQEKTVKDINMPERVRLLEAAIRLQLEMTPVEENESHLLQKGHDRVLDISTLYAELVAIVCNDDVTPVEN